ncbi:MULTISPECIES: tyrosine-protein phosphatase [unclassified Actinopolyspora]|uniref:tyrosine-protein phosphatase n=1 Tax=Actinopolyspora TaxID=1849 RepID=UPI0013F61D62|nr:MULTISPECIES: tyrosine-protein phosphatase [unclassified Actinopolyspora]NHD17406.1 tyrosine-protein phosphatase [Actinopolyspora sp. BKK2]NHE76861.1 tyrosine-protein phosphatase [Actinopolyspora sp. BKK1]
MSEQIHGSPDGLVNFRDLGGLPADDGVTTRSGVLYRGDAPYVGDNPPEGAEQWPPAVVIDLRDTDAESDVVHPLDSTSAVHRVPVLEGLRGESGEDPWLTLDELYAYMVRHAPKRLLEVFRITVEADGPVLIHCAAGKDRTGVACALLLRAAGVRHDAIVADYVRTDRNMRRVLQRLRVAPALPPGVDEADVNELISAPGEAIEHALELLDSAEGGAAGWLLEQGATVEELERWRRRFLEPAD